MIDIFQIIESTQQMGFAIVLNYVAQALTVIMGLTGCYLLAHHKKIGFLFYLSASLLTAALTYSSAIYGLVLLHLLYAGMDSYGFLCWKKKEKMVVTPEGSLVNSLDESLTKSELLKFQQRINELLLLKQHKLVADAH